MQELWQVPPGPPPSIVSPDEAPRSRTSIAGFVDPHLCAPVGARRNRHIEAIVLSHLPKIGAGAGSNGTGNFGDAGIVVCIHLLVDEDESLAAGNVNAFAGGVIPHVVGVRRAR